MYGTNKSSTTSVRIPRGARTIMSRRAVLLAVTYLAASAPLVAQSQRPITIHAGTILDGKGGVLRDATVMVNGSKIDSVGPSAGQPTFNFPTLTILPGMIDTH